MAACFGKEHDDLVNSPDTQNEPLPRKDVASDANSLKTDINGEKAYDVVASYSDEELRDFLNCVTALNTDASTKTRSIAQILIKRETEALREESGSGDDSTDSSKQTQSRGKSRHSSLRYFQTRYGSRNLNAYPYPGDQHTSSGVSKVSAAARNTAGSLGSLHDLTSSGADASSGRCMHSSAACGSGTGTCGVGGHGRRHHNTARSALTGRDTYADGEEEGGDRHTSYQRTSTRARTGGSCGNLSCSSFDTQPPGSRKRSRRSRGAAPASTSTKEGGSLQNLSKVEGCGGDEDQKRLHKSGSLSQVFSEEATTTKKNRGRKRSSDTPYTHPRSTQRASEERSSVAASADFTTSDDDEEDEYHPYQPLSPHHSPTPPSHARLAREHASDAAGGGTAATAARSQEPMELCSSYAVSREQQSNPVSDDEHNTVHMEDMRRSAHITLASAVVDPRGADEGVELVEVVPHMAERDVTASPSWGHDTGSVSGGGRGRSSSPPCASASFAVGKKIGFFKGSELRAPRDQDCVVGVQHNRSHSIESDSFTSNSTDDRGSERERLRTQRSDPSQLGRCRDTITTTSTSTIIPGGGVVFSTSTTTSPSSSSTTSSSSTSSSAPPSHHHHRSSMSSSLSAAAAMGGTGSGGPMIMAGSGDSSSTAASVGGGLTREPEKLRKMKLRVAKKKERQMADVQIAENTPGYMGRENLDKILSYIGMDDDEAASYDGAAVNTNKKSKKQVVSGKKDDRKERDKRDEGKKVPDTSVKLDDECKDDHKKEDSGGGGGSVEKKKKKEEKKGSGGSSKVDEGPVKKEMLENDWRKNGIVYSAGGSSGVGCNSVSKDRVRSNSLSSNLAGIVGSGDQTLNLTKDISSFKSSTACDTSRSVKTNLETSKSNNYHTSTILTLNTSDSHSKANPKKTVEERILSSTPSCSDSSKAVCGSKKLEKKVSSSCGVSNNSSVTSGSASASKKNKKSSTSNTSGNKGMRESSSVEDLVSKCRLSEQITDRQCQKTVDDGEVSSKRQKGMQRRTAEANYSGNKDVYVKDKNKKPIEEVCGPNENNKNRRAVDDIKVKCSSSSNSNKSNVDNSSSSCNSKNLSRRLSSSNSNLSSTTKASEFGQDFYKAGDPYVSGSPSKQVIVPHVTEEFEVVTRRKNRYKKSSGSSSAQTSGTIGSFTATSGVGASWSNKPRWGEENTGRDGYREYASNSCSGSFKSNISKNTSRCSPNASFNSNSNASVNANATYKVKPPINFEEAPRTPHDGTFMAHLSANNVGDRSNTATSAPNSDCSDSDGDDSVHSMPTPSTTPRLSARKQASSSDTTPQASYANIARLAGPANKKQVKRMTSGGAATAASASTIALSGEFSHQSNFGVTDNIGHSAAACATSDQSLLTTNAWPRTSSGSASSATVVNCAATGAAASAPAIPSVVCLSAAASATSYLSSGGIKARATDQGLLLTGLHAKGQAVQQPTQNFLEENFPPLKPTTTSSVANRRSSDEISSLLSSDPMAKHRDSAGMRSTNCTNDDGKLQNMERVNKTTDQESSPLATTSTEFGHNNTNSSVSNLVCSSCNKKSPRGNMSSSIKENTPNTTEDNETVGQISNIDSGCLLAGPSHRSATISNIDSGSTYGSAVGRKQPQTQLLQSSRVLQQVSSNIEHKKAPSVVNTRGDPGKQHGSANDDPISRTNNNTPSYSVSRSKDKRMQNDPVVFADPLQVNNMRNIHINLTFMFESFEDLTSTDMTSDTVVANNIANYTISDANGNPVVDTFVAPSSGTANIYTNNDYHQESRCVPAACLPPATGSVSTVASAPLENNKTGNNNHVISPRHSAEDSISFVASPSAGVDKISVPSSSSSQPASASHVVSSSHSTGDASRRNDGIKVQDDAVHSPVSTRNWSSQRDQLMLTKNLIDAINFMQSSWQEAEEAMREDPTSVVVYCPDSTPSSPE